MLSPNFDLMNGLIPAVIQDFETNEVLMVGYVNKEAWQQTLSTGKVHYYSRKKKRIWLKGEQSGNFQFVKDIFLNCDNTSLLIKVEQIGGACDQGLRSCFDKFLNDGEFVRRGTKVFDPRDAYGENYSEELILGLPSGSLEAMTFHLIELAGYQVDRTTRSYHPEINNSPSLKLIMARAGELPLFVERGVVDIALTGLDMIVDSGVSVQVVRNLKYNKLGLGPVALALAIPDDMAVGSLYQLEGMRVATAYTNLARRYFENLGITVQIIPSAGTTEGKVPLIADAIIDLVETGSTLKANHLKPIAKIFETATHLIANNESWGYTWKRKKIEEIACQFGEAALQLPTNPKISVLLPEATFRSISF